MRTTTRHTATSLLVLALDELLNNDEVAYGELVTEAYDAAERDGRGDLTEAIEALPFPDEDNDHGPWTHVLADDAAAQIRAILRDELGLN